MPGAHVIVMRLFVSFLKESANKKVDCTNSQLDLKTMQQKLPAFVAHEHQLMLTVNLKKE